MSNAWGILRQKALECIVLATVPGYWADEEEQYRLTWEGIRERIAEEERDRLSGPTGPGTLQTLGSD